MKSFYLGMSKNSEEARCVKNYARSKSFFMETSYKRFFFQQQTSLWANVGKTLRKLKRNKTKGVKTWW